MAYRAFFDEKREFGIELEGFGLSGLEMVEVLESAGIPAYYGDAYRESDKWVVSRDGTIKHNYPVEIISPILLGSKGLKTIEKICSITSRTDLKTDESCGFHIHWNVSDFTGRSAINLLRLYAKYEKIIDRFFDQTRQGDTNENCRSLIKQGSIEWIYLLNKPFFYQAYQIAQEFETTQQLENTTSSPSSRHHKVNLCAINKYGTIEFRQHHGTFNFLEIKNWIIFSQQLINRAKNSIVGDGVATWDSLIRTLALSERQLQESLETPDKKLLRQAREFYRGKIKNESNGRIRELQLLR